jgi:heme-degrading monooxygenase HmoA
MIPGMSASGLAAGLPEPPYYAVIFSSLRTAGDQGYDAMAERMLALARAQPGFLGFESARRDEESIARWKRHAEHLVAQARGKRDLYEAYELRVARVERVASMLAREPARP